MADSSRNPGAQANLEALARELQALQARIQESTNMMDTAAQRELTATSELEAAVRTEVSQRSQRIGTGVQAAEPAIVKQATAATDQLATAQQRATAAAAERLGIEQQERALMAEMSALLQRRLTQLQGGGGGIVPPGRPPAPPGGPGEPFGPYGAAGGPTQAAVLAEQVARAKAYPTVPDQPAPKGINLQTDALTEQERALQRNLALGQQLRASQQSLGTATEYEARSVSLASQAYTRHGALQTEWLAALAKGQVTVRDFGAQMTATIGKFAGWTAAAGAAYAVIGAVTELGTGALHGLSGVDQLHRTIDTLDTGRASEQIRNLATGTASTLQEASDAVFQFSRTFHNQDDAVYAAGLALRAYRLDGVSLNDQVRAQTALSQQFGLSAKELGPIYDQLAAGQRIFNARITDQIPALQRSASAIKNAGGDLSTYIELLQIAIRTTQLSGAQVGTAFARGTANFLNPNTAKGQTDRNTLAALGIDPNQNITSLLVAALKKSPQLSPAQRQQVSQAIFGPLRGGLFAGFFTGGPSLLAQAQKELTPRATTGALTEEFSRFLRVPTTQVKELGSELQALGSRLASSGLLDGIGLLVHALQLSLELANDLLKPFDALPGPIKEAVGLLAGLRIAGLAVGRFAPDSKGAGVIGGIGNALSPGRGQKVALQKLLDEEAQLERDALESSRKRIFTLTRTQTVAQQRVGTETATYDAMKAGGVQGEELAAQSRLVGQVTRRLEQIENQIYEASLLEAEARSNIATLRTQSARFSAATAKRGVTFESAAAYAGVGFTGPAGRPGSALPQEIGGQELAAQQQAQVARTTFLGAYRQLRPSTDALAATEQESAVELQRMSLSARAGATAAGVANAATSAASAGLRGLGSLINPWTVLLFGLPTAIGYVNSAVQQMNAASAAVNAALAAPPSLANLDQLLRAAEHKAAVENSFAHRLEEVWKNVKNDFGKAIKAITPDRGQADWLHLFPDAATQPQGKVVPITGASGIGLARQQIESVLGGAVKQAGQIAASTQSQGDLARKLGALQHSTLAGAQIGDVFKAAGLSPSIARKATRDFETEIYNIWFARDQALEATKLTNLSPLQQLLNQIHQTGGLSQEIAALHALSERAKVYGVTTGQLQEMARLFVAIAASQSQSMDPATLQKVDSAKTEMVAAIQTHLQTLTDAANAITIPSAKVAGVAAHAAALQRRSRLLNQASQQLKLLLAVVGEAARGFSTDLATTVQNLANAKTALDAINAQIASGASNEIGALSALPSFAGGKAKNSGTTLSELKQLLQQKAAQLDQQVTQDQAAAKAVGQINTSLGPTLNKFAKGQQTALNSLGAGPSGSTTDPFELDRLRREIAKAQADGDPVAQARVSVAEARDEIRVAKNERERLQGQLDLITAQNELSKAVADLVQARFKYLESLTTDPLKIDRLDIQAQNAAIRATKPGTADRYNALAARNAAKTKYRDDRVSQREDDIQFQLSMNDITTQQALLDIQALLKIRNLSYDTRKRLRRELEQLRKGSQDQFQDLNLGSIRLPTPYEIRRATLAAEGGMNITQHFSTTIQTTDTRSAVNQVGPTVERHLSRAGKSIRRAAMVRGPR